MPDQPPEPLPDPQYAAPDPATKYTTATTTGPTLILGGTGSFGGGLARELLHRSEPIRIFSRNLDTARARFGTSPLVEYFKGDALDSASVARAAEGCGVIVHAMNYPYHMWAPNMRISTNNVIAAAADHNATILFPGNVYGLGEQFDTPLSESAENLAETRKGRLRIILEEQLQEATEGGQIRVLILRAGDFFGPTVRNGLVDPIFGAAASGKSMRVLGELEQQHQWAYMPDLCRVAVDLLRMTDRLSTFEVVHFAGHTVASTGAFMRQIATLAGHPELKINRPSWVMLRGVGLFNSPVHELLELRYLFDHAVLLDDRKLRTLLPDFALTPLERAVRSTIASYRG